MRNNTVTVAKGIGILLMVLGHSGSPAIAQNFMYFFHMPFFFFASGLFYKAYQEDYSGYIKRKVKNLWWPFVKWSYIFLFFHNILYNLCLTEDIYSFKDVLLKACIIPFMFGNDNLLGGYWFLNELFYGTMFITGLCYVLLRFPYFKDKLQLSSITISLSIFFALLVMAYLYPTKPIIFITKMSSSIVSITLGFYASSLQFNKWKIESLFSIYKLFISILILLIGAIIYPVSRTSVGIMHPIGGIYMIIMSLVGIYMMFCIAHYINIGGGKLKIFLIFTGEKTLTILTWHFLSFKIVSAFIVFFYHLPVRRIAEHATVHGYSRIGYWILYFIVGSATPLIFSYLNPKFRNYFLRNS